MSAKHRGTLVAAESWAMPPFPRSPESYSGPSDCEPGALMPPSAAMSRFAAIVTLVVGLLGCSRTTLSGFDLGATVTGGSPADGGAGGSGGEGLSQGGFGASGAGGSGGEGAGIIGDCDDDNDCVDPSGCLVGRCESATCQWSDVDRDQDGETPEMCGGSDCNDLNPNVGQNQSEICADGADNDCDGVADCVDPACENVPDCGCVPEPEDCDNGVDDNCDTIVDCFDAACLGTPACGCVAEVCGNGVDDDCDGPVDCSDADCANNALCNCAPNDESCDNGADDDCDFRVDCEDPECGNDPACRCFGPPSPENCFDFIDNDCDEQTDCADLDCVNSPACQQCSQEVCSDALDNDCNNLIDCGDPACALSPSCQAVQELCNNELDDDLDQKVDCSDPDCAASPNCVLKQSNCFSPKAISASGSYTGDTTGNIGTNKGTCGGDAGEAIFQLTLDEASYVEIDTKGTSFDSNLYLRSGVCDSGVELGCDDDSGNDAWSARLVFPILYPGTYFIFVDGYTIDAQEGPNQGAFVLNAEVVESPDEVCGDSTDNDGDVYVDCADSDCQGFGFCSTCRGGLPGRAEFGDGRCTNGVDDDCDGATDCVDRDCSASDVYNTECCNAEDDNGNQIPDDGSCRCNSDSDCLQGQICYRHTANVCQWPCDGFFGDICPFVAAGSHCSSVTGQCEF